MAPASRSPRFSAATCTPTSASGSSWRFATSSRLLEQEARNLRTQFGSEIDSREAYVDLIVLNAYSAPGTIDLWIDDLEIDGYVNLDEHDRPAGRPPHRPTDQPRQRRPARLRRFRPPSTARCFMVRGRPFDAPRRAASGRALRVAQLARLQHDQAQHLAFAGRA